MEYLATIRSPTEKHFVFESLLHVARGTPVVDNHAHPFCYNTGSSETRENSVLPLKQVLSESSPINPNALPADAQSTLTLSRSIREMHELLTKQDCFADEPVLRPDIHLDAPESNHTFATQQALVESMRTALGVQRLAEICFKAANISAVLIDDGLPSPVDKIPIPVTGFENKLNVPVARRVLRLESEAEICLAKLVSNNQLSGNECPETMVENATVFRKQFRQHVEKQLHNVIAFKSIAAYRSSLKIDVDVSDHQLGQTLSNFLKCVQISSEESQPIRLSHSVLIEATVAEGFRLARKHHIPVQFHCGFGDPDVDLPNANPVLLRALIHKYPDVPIIILHGAWPYVREAAFLSNIYPNVYVDIGLAIPLLSVRGMSEMVASLFEFAPLNRIMYSSDAHSTPDMFYLAAYWGRKVIAAVATESIFSGELSEEQAREAIVGILANNAIDVYKLPLEPYQSEHPARTETPVLAGG